MNPKRLHQIFDNYIAKFDIITDRDTSDESFKWEVAALFRPMMDNALAADDDAIHGRLMELWKQTSVLIDSRSQQPFYALCQYAKHEPGRVRSMLRTLLQPDGGNLRVRQERILHFLDECEALRSVYFPANWRSQAYQRTAMAYLALYYPEDNYLYKAVQAQRFADCVSYLDDWGSGVGFRLDLYYRMCDALVEQIMAYEPLLTIHRNRYSNTTRSLHPDQHFHILAFDIIYCASVYQLMDSIPQEKLSSDLKRQRKANREKAENLLDCLHRAQQDMDRLDSARHDFLELLPPGTQIRYKGNIPGTITSITNHTIAAGTMTTVTVRFPDKEMTFDLLSALSNGILSAEGDACSDALAQYAEVMERQYRIPAAHKAALDAYTPYSQYLD